MQKFQSHTDSYGLGECARHRAETNACPCMLGFFCTGVQAVIMCMQQSMAKILCGSIVLDTIASALLSAAALALAHHTPHIHPMVDIHLCQCHSLVLVLRGMSTRASSARVCRLTGPSLAACHTSSCFLGVSLTIPPPSSPSSEEIINVSILLCAFLLLGTNHCF